MFETVREFISGSYAPHGYCLLWDPWLVWTMAIADALIALAYLSIPMVLITFVRKRRDVAFGGVFWLFALFITACGLTHLVGLWNLWNGAYALEAVIKLITAAASVVTAIVLWPLLPKAIALPSPARLREANKALRAQIAEREKTEAALVQARKMEAMGQLTGGIAHDFNNLLQVVSGSLDLINNRAGGDERIQHLCGAAISAIERGRRLTSQLLSFSRIQRIELRPTRIADILAGLRELLSRTIEPAITLDFDVDEVPEAVMADPVQLELALLNLAINARDAMPDGGRLTIALGRQRLEGRDDVLDGDYVGITVADTGTGMTPEVLSRVFEPFFTTKPVGRGSGLGLSMVFGMARQSGGTVTIDSQPGRGSTVTIFLRAAEEADEEEAAPRKAAPADAATIAGLNILVVDDEPIVRQVVAEMLVELGCTVRTAENGERALAMIEREMPSAILLDFAMPGMNGAEVARAALERWPDLKIVFATGFAQSDAIDAVLGDRAIVLRKPFSPNTLVQALQSAMVA
ncbi:response regulator [Sphingomonas histidinilytica]|jgi:signal transduction histidine kinase|uniref:histidine kinase n=1 Tax=Rhizorhabdus histidinilytica TaxID=439228 RepID=A0A1T5AYD6_9SPHN|nr:ATP-binding protein [Rhizorhabdus histidinilytica]MBO9377755.1 response regulator [Rhizorhabdus histidinilytica]QEH79531.1 response regulator [Sphingomonas sp. C8-2]SKB40028.1 His Kinase A (phospho-acceptor) domain-containing protein [Rhizorhabdus histidinilytica]